MPEIEAAVVTYEAVGNIYKAADLIRPPKELPDDRDPITQEATAQWLRRRVGWVRATLITVAGLFPELFCGCEMTLTAFRNRLRSDSVLMDLRGICAEKLSALPAPVGFGHRSEDGKPRARAVQQCLRSDRPP